MQRSDDNFEQSCRIITTSYTQISCTLFDHPQNGFEPYNGLRNGKIYLISYLCHTPSPKTDEALSPHPMRNPLENIPLIVDPEKNFKVIVKDGADFFDDFYISLC